MIFLPSAVSSTPEITSASAGGGMARAGGASATGASGAEDIARIREIGGRHVRRTVLSLGARFGFGVCGSMSERLSIACRPGGGAAGGTTATEGAGFSPGGFFAVIRAKADFVGGIAGFGAETGVVFAAATGRAAKVTGVAGSAAAADFLVVLGLFAVLAAAGERTDDFAGAALFAALRAGAALGALVLVVVVF